MEWTALSAELVDPRHADRSPTRIYMGDQKVRLEVTEGAVPRSCSIPCIGTLLLISPENKTYLDAGMLAPLAAAGIGPSMRFVRPVAAGDPCVQSNPTVDEFASFMQKRTDKTSRTSPARTSGSESVNGRSAHKSARGLEREARRGHRCRSTTGCTSSPSRWTATADGARAGIHEGSQPGTLFEAPAGYRKLGLSEMLARPQGSRWHDDVGRRDCRQRLKQLGAGKTRLPTTCRR